MKKSRAGVSIEGQYVLLQNSHRINVRFLSKLPYESLLSRYTSEPMIFLFFYFFLLETRLQSSKNAQKLIKCCKIIFFFLLFFKAIFFKGEFSIFFNILRPHFQNSIVPIFFVLSSKMEHKKNY